MENKCKAVRGSLAVSYWCEARITNKEKCFFCTRVLPDGACIDETCGTESCTNKKAQAEALAELEGDDD